MNHIGFGRLGGHLNRNQELQKQQIQPIMLTGCCCPALSGSGSFLHSLKVSSNFPEVLNSNRVFSNSVWTTTTCEESMVLPKEMPRNRWPGGPPLKMLLKGRGERFF